MIFNNPTLVMARAETTIAGYQPWGTEVINPDFAAVARAAGMHGERVADPAAIDDAIRTAFAGRRLPSSISSPTRALCPCRRTRAWRRSAGSP